MPGASRAGQERPKKRRQPRGACRPARPRPRRAPGRRPRAGGPRPRRAGRRPCRRRRSPARRASAGRPASRGSRPRRPAGARTSGSCPGIATARRAPGRGRTCGRSRRWRTSGSRSACTPGASASPPSVGPSRPASATRPVLDRSRSPSSATWNDPERRQSVEVAERPERLVTLGIVEAREHEGHGIDGPRRPPAPVDQLAESTARSRRGQRRASKNSRAATSACSCVLNRSSHADHAYLNRSRNVKRYDAAVTSHRVHADHRSPSTSACRSAPSPTPTTGPTSSARRRVNGSSPPPGELGLRRARPARQLAAQRAGRRHRPDREVAAGRPHRPGVPADARAASPRRATRPVWRWCSSPAAAPVRAVPIDLVRIGGRRRVRRPLRCPRRRAPPHRRGAPAADRRRSTAGPPGRAVGRASTRRAGRTPPRTTSLQLGHRRLAVIAFAPHGVGAYNSGTMRRLAGYRQADGRGRPRPRRPARSSRAAPTTGPRRPPSPATCSTGHDRPTGVLAMSDEMAVAVIDAADELGLRRPGGRCRSSASTTPSPRRRARRRSPRCASRTPRRAPRPCACCSAAAPRPRRSTFPVRAGRARVDGARPRSDQSMPTAVGLGSPVISGSLRSDGR